MAGVRTEALIDPWEQQDAEYVAKHDARRVSAGLPTIEALVADVLADQDATDAVIGALEEAGRLWHVNHSERSMAEAAVCRVMLTLAQYGFMPASAYRVGDDVTPDFSQSPGELIEEAVRALSEIIGDNADDYVAQACQRLRYRGGARQARSAERLCQKSRIAFATPRTRERAHIANPPHYRPCASFACGGLDGSGDMRCFTRYLCSKSWWCCGPVRRTRLRSYNRPARRFTVAREQSLCLKRRVGR